MTAPNAQYANLLCPGWPRQNSCAANPQVPNADQGRPCNQTPPCPPDLQIDTPPKKVPLLPNKSKFGINLAVPDFFSMCLAPPKMNPICCGEGNLKERWVGTRERVVEGIVK